MEHIQKLRQKAKSNPKTIVLPEWFDSRVLLAADKVLKEGYANLIILGDELEVIEKAKTLNADVSRAKFVDMRKSGLLDTFSDELMLIKRSKWATKEDAKKMLLEEPAFDAALMVRLGIADGFVAGASFTTADVAKAAIYCIGPDKSSGTVSSVFIMILPNTNVGADGLFIFSDCGIVPTPSPAQLANIAVSAAQLMKKLFDYTPKVAMLSYSTKGSASGPCVQKVIDATNLAKQIEPGLIIDGELQADAAVVAPIAKIKSPDSPIQGDANILIFPDLDCGNISYKLVERLALGRAVGPIMLGLNKPASDLSRGCEPEDIVDAICITVVRSQ